MNGAMKKMHAKFWLENVGRRDYHRDRYGWKNNIKMDTRERGFEHVNWIKQVQHRDQ
jgi:hypothetical protein